jgi:drug/metabolite transporter (DMT)-like permease
MTVFLLALVISGTVGGDLLKAKAMRQNGEVADFRPDALGRVAAAVARRSWIWLAIACYAVSFFGFMALVSIADVSFAVPATAAGFVVETVLAKYILGEAVPVKRWASAALVAAGVFLVGG